MSQLIRMRQRIKAIKTIKKITHALRLISMSTHLRLRSKKNAIETYKASITQLFIELQKNLPTWKHPFITKGDLKKPALIILVGSQKGLCGNFNTELFSYYEKEVDPTIKHTAEYITVGKKAHDYIRFLDRSIAHNFDEFTFSTLENISNHITHSILEHHEKYSLVTIYSNYSKSFFSQKPHATSLIPFEPPTNAEEVGPQQEYIWEQKPEEVLNFLLTKLVHVSIYETLFQSLIAEQAARFIAMDNSTRSAGKLLESMQLQYNKMRQSKITGELTDLIGGFF